ncbi:MAG: SMP-30/gluconolactonase/LRE family protein [Pirellulaceae bacterium]
MNRQSPYATALLLFSALAAPLAAQDMPLSDVLIDGEGWEQVAEGYRFTEGPAVDSQGNLFFVDVPADLVLKHEVASGETTTFASEVGGTSGLMFGPDGKLYGSQLPSGRIVRFSNSGEVEVIAEAIGGNDLAIAENGDIYTTDPSNQQVWLIRPNGEKEVVASGFGYANGVILWGDGGSLVVADTKDHSLWTFRVEADGTLSAGAKDFALMLPLGVTEGRADGMTVDTKGRLYVASAYGLQMFDSTARISGVISNPHTRPMSNVVFAGPDRQTLYITCGDKLFRRKTAANGVR